MWRRIELLKGRDLAVNAGLGFVRVVEPERCRDPGDVLGDDRADGALRLKLVIRSVVAGEPVPTSSELPDVPAASGTVRPVRPSARYCASESHGASCPEVR